MSPLLESFGGESGVMSEDVASGAASLRPPSLADVLNLMAASAHDSGSLVGGGAASSSRTPSRQASLHSLTQSATRDVHGSARRSSSTRSHLESHGGTPLAERVSMSIMDVLGDEHEDDEDEQRLHAMHADEMLTLTHGSCGHADPPPLEEDALDDEPMASAACALSEDALAQAEVEAAGEAPGARAEAALPQAAGAAVPQEEDLLLTARGTAASKDAADHAATPRSFVASMFEMFEGEVTDSSVDAALLAEPIMGVDGLALGMPAFNAEHVQRLDHGAHIVPFKASLHGLGHMDRRRSLDAPGSKGKAAASAAHVAWPPAIRAQEALEQLAVDRAVAALRLAKAMYYGGPAILTLLALALHALYTMLAALLPSNALLGTLLAGYGLDSEHAAQASTLGCVPLLADLSISLSAWVLPGTFLRVRRGVWVLGLTAVDALRRVRKRAGACG